MNYCTHCGKQLPHPNGGCSCVESQQAQASVNGITQQALANPKDQGRKSFNIGRKVITRDLPKSGSTKEEIEKHLRDLKDNDKGRCICGEINARHCPVHNEPYHSKSEMRRIEHMKEPDAPPRVYSWVPEDCIFESAPDCLDEFPDHGAAALVASHVAYDALAKELTAAKADLNRLVYELDKSRADHVGKLNEANDRIKELEGSQVSRKLAMADAREQKLVGLVAQAIACIQSHSLKKTVQDDFYKFLKAHRGEGV